MDHGESGSRAGADAGQQEPSAAGAPAQRLRSRGPFLAGLLAAAWLAPGGAHAAFAAFARASGYDIPVSGSEFLYSLTRIARSFATFSGTVTAGAGGGAGYLRLPLDVTGQVLVSWQNGAGSAQLGAGCQSNEPGAPLVLGNCPALQLLFTENEAIDTVVEFDVPILLGSPIEFRVNVTVSAQTGHGFGPAPFTGASEASFATGPFRGAVVLDAAKNPIPGAAMRPHRGSRTRRSRARGPRGSRRCWRWRRRRPHGRAPTAGLRLEGRRPTASDAHRCRSRPRHYAGGTRPSARARASSSS